MQVQHRELLSPCELQAQDMTPSCEFVCLFRRVCVPSQCFPVYLEGFTGPLDVLCMRCRRVADLTGMEAACVALHGVRCLVAVSACDDLMLTEQPAWNFSDSAPHLILASGQENALLQRAWSRVQPIVPV